MEENKLGKESAFPTEVEHDGVFGMGYKTKTQGISKRFYAACAAMQGLISNGSFNIYEPENPSQIAHKAYELADELLERENE